MTCTQVLFVEDSTRLVATSGSYEPILWDGLANRYEKLKTVIAPDPSRFRWSPGRRLVASVAMDDGQVEVLSRDDGSKLFGIPAANRPGGPSGSDDDRPAASLSPDGSRIARVGADREAIVIWEPAEGRVAFEPKRPGRTIRSAELTAEGLITVSRQQSSSMGDEVILSQSSVKSHSRSRESGSQRSLPTGRGSSQ